MAASSAVPGLAASGSPGRRGWKLGSAGLRVYALKLGEEILLGGGKVGDSFIKAWRPDRMQDVVRSHGASSMGLELLWADVNDSHILFY